MWGWIFVLLTLALLFYLYFLKREIRKLKVRVIEMPTRSGYGGRLSLDFREKRLLDLVDEVNKMVDAFEEKNLQAKQMEENVKLSIAGLSHDLRTPLTSIHGYVQLLNGTTDATKREHYLRIIEHSVSRLLEMTDNFYNLARIETNQKEMEFAPLSLSNLVVETFLSFYQQLEEKGIEVHFPEQVEDSKILADQLMLTRVIQNLVQNILRYAEREVEIRYASEDEFVTVSMKNDIKPNSQLAIEKVFTRFYTEVSSRTNTESSGLGLYLSKKLVEKMNGTMEAEVQGTWFIIYIRLPKNRIN